YKPRRCLDGKKGGRECYVRHHLRVQSQNISCEGGATISVLKATYGRDDNETCPNKYVFTTNCSAESSLSVVQGICNDQASCNLIAINSVFGDPCFGTFKYLRVTYECIEDKAAPITLTRKRLPVTVFARYIRFHPISQLSWNALRVEVYEEIDECASNIHNCHGHAVCLNSVGSFECICNPGYTGDGKDCSDIDDCLTNASDCDQHATCVTQLDPSVVYVIMVFQAMGRSVQ
ncbi:uncharacterized protein, partial [Montipora capricornis]|uniref:uncharacterized protein n=1 Tax=Montipora capricornis TaxID=246305 RepID=UPI0035F146EE